MAEVDDRRADARDRDRLLLFLIGLTTLAVYLAVEQGLLVSWDGRAMASVALNLSRHGSLKECCGAFGAFPKDPGPYSVFGIGLTLLLTPLWSLQSHSNHALNALFPNATWLGLANPALLAAATVVIAKTGLLLGWRRSSATFAALSFALLTMAPYYSTELFPEPGVTLGVALLMLGLVHWQHDMARGAALVGGGVGVAILFRPDSIVLVAPALLCLPLLRGPREMLTSWRSWLWRLTLPLTAVLAWTLYYNWLRFGELLQFGSNSVYDRRGFSTPLLRGLGLLLWSPGLSFFVYAPILLAALPGIVWLARRRPPIAVVVVALCILRLVFYAKWWGPWGGDEWGPRFLLPLSALLALPLGETFERIHSLRVPARRLAIAAIGALVALSVVVEVATFSMFDLAVYARLRDPKGIPIEIQHAVISRRTHRFYWTLRENHIVWNLRHAGDDHWFALEWFRSGPTPFGLGMTALAVIALVAALRLALGSDRRFTES